MQRYVDKLCSLGLTRADAALIVRDFIKDMDFGGLHAYIAELEAIKRPRKENAVVEEALAEIGLEKIS